MANEVSKREENRVTVALGVTNDASQELRMFRVDPSTNRLLVNTTITGSISLTGPIQISDPVSGEIAKVSKYIPAGDETESSLYVRIASFYQGANLGVSVGAGNIVDGGITTLGLKADARNTATDTTAVTAMSVLKEISYMEQNPASRVVTATDLDIRNLTSTDVVTVTGGTGQTADVNVTSDSKFYTNDVDNYTTTSVVYIGKETAGGTYMIIKIDSTGNFPVFTYASITNNPTYTTFATAWAARVTPLVYNIYSVAF